MKNVSYLSLIAIAVISSGIAWAASSPGLAIPATNYDTVVSGYYLSRGNEIAVDSRGNAYVVGGMQGNDNDFLVVKIGPTGSILWTTAISGSKHDIATDIALTATNDVYVTGFTDSPDFPVVDALDDTLTGFRDAFVMKLASNTGAILYSTYLGGDYVDQGAGIALNQAGEIFIHGSTESSDFPTVNPIQPNLNGPAYAYSDTFVTQLSADGSTILYSTYLGGSDDDAATDIALSADGDIYLAGSTESFDFPIRRAVQPANSGDSDLYVTRLSPTGDRIVFSTYVGGEDLDRLASLTLDDAGSAYVTGATRSRYFPTTPGAFQELFAGAILGCGGVFGGAYYNCEDAFVAKVSADGKILYSSYLGGSKVDQASDIAVDRQGRVYVVGYSSSSDFPMAPPISGSDIFLSKLSADGSSLLSTDIIDSSSANAGHGVALGAQSVFLTGAVNAPADLFVSRRLLIAPLQ